MKVDTAFTFAGVEYEPGDEIDLDALDADDRQDLISRGVLVDTPKAKKASTKHPVEKP